MKVRSIDFVAAGKVELCERDIPDELAPDQVLLKTECTLVSPGTEFANLSGQTNRGPAKYPATLGYSAVARVLAVGSAVTSLKTGDRCLCYHSKHRNFQLMPERDVVKIEYDAVPSEEAVFCVVGCMGFQGVRRCRPELGESLLVMGLGLLGQFAVQTARLSGCFPVIAMDFSPFRRALALKLGADAAFSPDDPGLEDKIAELTRGRKCDSVVEVTGNPQAVVQGLELTARFGRIALVGCNRTPTEKIDFYNLVHRPGITVIGAHNMARPGGDRRPGVWTMREDMAVLLRYLAAGRLDSRSLVTGIADPASAPEVYARLMARDPEQLGVVFDWKNY
ncbi:MAG: zinc-binding dehydrogenase [Lentisphaeria bacterium]|nr:zinc-binding dehydrogenase [Lentisphaeria bacterium]